MFHFIIRSVRKNWKAYGFLIIDHNIIHIANFLITNAMAIDRYKVNTVDGISGGRHDEKKGTECWKC